MAISDSDQSPDPSRGVLLAVLSAASMPVGQGLGAHAFDALTPPGVVAGRQLVTAVILTPLVRPRVRTLTWSQWWPALLLGVLFVGMNLSLAWSIDRIGVALAVTLEFLGPLAVALVGSRHLRDGLCALAAGAGVWLLVGPGGDTDALGVLLALAAATGWASYILLNRTAGRRLPGLEGTTIGALTATLLCSPVLGWLILQGRITWSAMGFVIAAGLLSSLVPYASDLLALRHIPARLFGIVVSLNPVFAALAGTFLLDESLQALELGGIGLIVIANGAAVLFAPERRNGPSRSRPATDHPQPMETSSPAARRAAT